MFDTFLGHRVTGVTRFDVILIRYSLCGVGWESRSIMILRFLLYTDLVILFTRKISPLCRSIVRSGYSNPISDPTACAASAAFTSPSASMVKIYSASTATSTPCFRDTTAQVVYLIYEVTQEGDDCVEDEEGWSRCCWYFSFDYCHIRGSDPLLEVVNLFVLRYFLLVVLEYLVLRNLSFREHLKCLMREIPCPRCSYWAWHKRWYFPYSCGNFPCSALWALGLCSVRCRRYWTCISYLKRSHTLCNYGSSTKGSHCRSCMMDLRDECP